MDEEPSLYYEGSALGALPMAIEVSGEESKATDPKTGSGRFAKFSNPISALIARKLRSNLTTSLLLVLLAWALTLAAAYLAFFILLPDLWRWVDGSVLRGIVAIFGSIGLFYIPFIPGMAAYNLTSAIADAHLSTDAANIQAAKERVRETEEDALNRLEKKDEAGLLPLLRYSRAQLDEYYAMGLAQTRRSFFHALVAMWLGFILLILGLALYVAPVEQLGLQRPSQDFSLMILGTGAIIEFISVLFLWIYRSTMGQLTFYYQLQIRTHTAILCFRMATAMKKENESDSAKLAIIKTILKGTSLPERPALEGSRGLRDWIGGSSAAGSASSAAPSPSRAPIDTDG